jgi:hypothetical protein
MPRGLALLACAFVIAIWCPPAGAVTAREILDRVDDLFRGRSARGRATMTVTTQHWSRTLALEFWSEGKEKSLIRILAPQKEKDTATLKVGNDIWNYLPKVKRVIKLPSTAMSASWMGSHFTNDDLVKESRMADDYTSSVTFEGSRNGDRIVEITCLPKPEAAVVWGKVVVVVRADDLLPVEVPFFDEDLRLARTVRYGDIRTLGGRVVPTTLTVVPADKPAESTMVRYEEIAFDVPLEPDTFSLRTLQR